MNALKPRNRFSNCLRLIGLCLLAIPNLGMAVSAGPTLQTLSPQDQKRAQYSLEMLIRESDWNAAQRGPLIALNSALVYRNAGYDLPVPGPSSYDLRLAASGFDRMLVSVGTISVLAPTTMTLIGDMPRERPNLYDGLPRDLKVKYLMATLTSQQWKTLAEKGLGTGDLTGEQRPVYLSLLPNPFIMERWPRNASGIVGDYHAIVTLTPDERANVRLQIHRSASVMAPLQNKPNTYAGVPSQYDPPGQPNGFKWVRDTRADSQKTDLFGVNLSSIVPNKAKQSQLDYAATRLNASVSLEGAATLGDLIARISAVTHLEIYADGRVACLPLLVRGSRARAGDVLRALALAVTGTFRKVDTAFVLTSDLTGIGTRQMQLVEWEAQIKVKTDQLYRELTKQILQHSGKNGGVLALGYASNAPYALTPALEQAALKRSDIPAANLTPALQQLLRDVAARMEKYNPNDKKIRDDAARLDFYWLFAFQLPDGSILPPEGNVGISFEYYPAPASGRVQNGNDTPPQLPPFVPYPLPAWAKPRTLFLTPRNLQDAVTMAQTAHRLGFTELALQTEDKAALKAAIAEAGKTEVEKTETRKKETQKLGSAEQKLRVYAVVAPFAVPASETVSAGSLDVNILGETAVQIVAARNALLRWNDFLERIVQHLETGFIASERIVGVESAIAPLGPNLEAHFHKIADLARTEGLAGLFLYDTQPGGYAGQLPDYIPNNSLLFERGNMGYSPTLRLAFLRKAGADPLDLTPPHINLDVDLVLPFFPDEVAASQATRRALILAFTLPKGMQWDAFRAETNRKAMSNLFALLRAAASQLPLLVEACAALNNVADAARFLPAWATWTQPEKLLVGTDILHSDKLPPPAKGERYLFPLQFSASELLPARLLLYMELEQLQHSDQPLFTDPKKEPPPGSLPMNAVPLALDLRYLPALQALALLNEFIVPALQSPPTADVKK